MTPISQPEQQSATSKAKLLDGALVANKVNESLAGKIEQYKKNRRAPGLAVVLVGNDPASEVYVKNKISTCKKIGIASVLHKFAASISKDELISAIKTLNNDDTIDGILLQLPLPAGLPVPEILDVIAADKDVDGLHPLNLGLLFAGAGRLKPCTPKGIIELLHHYQIPISGKHAVVIGRSNLVGKPVAALLLQENATVTICHSQTKNLPEIASQADILVVAAGKPQMVKADWIKMNACVVDVGIHRTEDGRLVGDVCFDEASKIASHITPVPGGVGKMTVAMLMANTLLAYEKHMGI